VRSQCPTEQEQLRVYKSLFEAMDGKPVVLRTLDVGGDKTLAYLAGENEDNPFMGLRAIRFSLLNQGIFREQLRAMLRAGAGCELRILFPMIGSVDDFRLAASMLRECIDELGARDIDHCSSPHVGAMIELPSAVELADELAAEADFLSIGSNDLVQYMLAVDRTNPQIAHYYTPHHPSVLRALKRVVNAARLHGKPLSLCGEIARDLSMLPFLLGVGFRSFSMEAASIPVVQQAVSSLVVEECEETARRALSEATIAGAARVLGINAADSAADRDSAQP
jgi:phosphotransferase system enzyme I (PtsP)